MMEIELLSLFPSYVQSPLEESILKRAIQKGLLVVRNTDIRAFSTDKWHRVDDRPFGGGPGMLLSPEPVSKAISSVRRPHSKVIYLSPQGVPLTAQVARELANESHLILLAGHYEGIDQRVLDDEVDLELSIGDFVLTNGCLAALVVIDAVARFIPGVLGHEDAASQDSFEHGLLDYPNYTKPLEYNGKTVPDVLRSGNHAEIALWRHKQQVLKTLDVRPDMVVKVLEQMNVPIPAITLFSADCIVLKKWYKQFGQVVDLPNTLGFYVTFGGVTIVFILSQQSTWTSLRIPLIFNDLRTFKRTADVVCKKSIHIADDNHLVLQDPEGRFLHFSCCTICKN